MPVFEYEVADPRGALHRGRAEAESQGAWILRFREQGRRVVGLAPIAEGGREVIGAVTYPIVILVVATGEESGTLPAMLARAAAYDEQQVDNTVATLSTLIEPIMIVVMGAIAGGVIFALYLPIFSLGQAIKGGLR